jgi:hypothetical protein
MRSEVTFDCRWRTFADSLLADSSHLPGRSLDVERGAPLRELGTDLDVVVAIDGRILYT